MNVVIAAGGTGGHLYPAVALAREFLRQEPRSRVLFVGSAIGLETRVLPREGFELRTILARPVMGVGPRKAIPALLSLPVGFLQSLTILRTQRAELVVGIGGYTSPPVLMAASLLSIPRVIVEPNAYPGMANKILGPLAHLIFVSFAEAAPYFAPSNVHVVGTPTRRAFAEALPAESEAPSVGGVKRLLIVGGSQGAHAINVAMAEALAHLDAQRSGLSVVHQTGEADYGRVKAAYEAAGFRAEVAPFLFDMPRVLRSADLVVSRAGAVTVAELAVCGKAAILIPFPHAIYQHQERNARAMEAAGAAVVLLQRELSGATLAQAICSLLGDPERIRAMEQRSRTLGRPDSAEAIVRECRGLIARSAT